jgi:heterogeneous nuclear ribonucleoprotein F/H
MNSGGNFGNNNSGNNCGGGGGNGGGYHPGNTFLVHLRGMPYDCGEKEIIQFFDPVNVVHAEVIYNNTGRHTGEADAYFATYEEAQNAMKKHKEKMGPRYIELFFKNRDDDRRGGNARRF